MSRTLKDATVKSFHYETHTQLREHLAAFVEAHDLGEAEAGDRLLTTAEASQVFGVSHRTLEDWRLRGGGPRFRKIGQRIVRYQASDLWAFVEGAARANTGYTTASG